MLDHADIPENRKKASAGTARSSIKRRRSRAMDVSMGFPTFRSSDDGTAVANGCPANGCVAPSNH